MSGGYALVEQGTQIFVGREDQLNEFRKLLRENILYKRMVLLGYYGIAGIGKSRLLAEMARIARTFTPYVVQLDFDPSAPGAPTDPASMLGAIVAQLETILEAQRVPLPARLFPFLDRRRNRLNNCRQRLNEARRRALSIQNIIHADNNGTIVGSTQQIHINGSRSWSIDVDEALRAFKVDFQRMPVLTVSPVGHKMRPQRPLLVLLADSVDYASATVIRVLREWLTEGFSAYCVLVCAGRNPIERLMERELKPLSDMEMRKYLIGQGIEDSELRKAIAEISGGVPLLLRLATEMACESAATAAEMKAGTGWEKMTAELLFKRYLDRLQCQWEEESDVEKRRHLKQEYYLIYYGSVLRAYESADQLAAILQDLPGTEGAFTRQDDYRTMLRRLEGRSYVTQGRLHPVIRELALNDLRQSDVTMFCEINQRAEAYYECTGDRVGQLYHQLLPDPNAGFGRLAKAFEMAMAEGDFPQASAVLNLVREDALAAAQQHHFILLKALLAFYEGDHAKARERLARICDPPRVPNSLGSTTCDLLRVWQNTLPKEDIARSIIALWLARCGDIQDGDARQRTEAEALYKLGEVARLQGQMKEARTHYEEALALYEKVGDPHGQAYALSRLCRTWLDEGKPEQAERVLVKLVAVVHNSECRHLWRAQIHDLAKALGLVYDESSGQLMKIPP